MTKNIRIGERVYWKNMFGIWNYGYVVALGDYCISARLPIDEENYVSSRDSERTIFLSDKDYITQAAYEQARAKRHQQLTATC